MVMLTYQMLENIKNVALNSDTNQFDLNAFFSTEGEGAQFKYKTCMGIMYSFRNNNSTLSCVSCFSYRNIGCIKPKVRPSVKRQRAVS